MIIKISLLINFNKKLLIMLFVTNYVEWIWFQVTPGIIKNPNIWLTLVPQLWTTCSTKDWEEPYIKKL